MSSPSGKSLSGKDDDVSHHFAERADSLEQVRKKLRSGWRNDDAVLNQYFQSCYTNWKIYKGKRTPQQVIKLQAIYKQAIYGDNPDPPPARADSAEGLKWIAWRKLTGTPKEMAKRRFITFLAEIDPLLIDVMPDEKPPIGFPLDRKGNPICAKCNTKVGCLRPLLDQNKTNLKQQLFENEELQNPKKFQEWVRNALANQRCVWGIHKAISRAEAKPFMAWFDKDENRGFYPYDSISLMLLIHEFIHHHHEVTFEMMLNRDDVDPQDYNAQAIKTSKLKEVYEQLAGEAFIFYIPCERDSESCNQRRAADGGKNHTHAQELDPPTYSDVNTLEEAVELRKQCLKLGVNPCTGVVVDIVQRCEIYRDRIAKHFEALRVAAIAKERNEKRHLTHAAEKAKVKDLSTHMLAKQCWDVCHLNSIPSVLQVVHRGCSPNEESPRGMTPLGTLVLNDAQIEQVEELLTLKANINFVNRYGMSPLIIACRMNNTKMVHILMRSGASALQKDDKMGRTALHWCVVHGCDELVKIICEYLKEGMGDGMRVTRFLDAQTTDGETALMLAAQQRNGIMCYALTQVGANPSMRNNKGRTAAYLARQRNWSEIADWLEKKIGAGMAKVETFSDLQFEKQHRFGLIKVKELMHDFGRTYLLLMQNRVGLHPLGCPFVAKSNVAERGERALTEQRRFMDNHQLYIFKRDLYEYQTGKKTDHNDQEHQQMKDLKQYVVQMVELLRAGATNPNTELEPKPLAWTPLMCAVAVSDLRSMKLMLREGADPNHPNRDGTTAVMLAAQLQNAEALAELLLHKGDLDAVDIQGYNVASYATALPLPSLMDRDVVGVLLDGDSDGPRHITSMEVIKIALLGGLPDLRRIIAERDAAALPKALDVHFRQMQLLEKYGLSTMQTERNIHDSVRSAAWRVKEPELFQQHELDPEEEQRQREKRNRQLLEKLRLKSQPAAPEKTADELSLEDLRCPVCTLPVPCAHFFKAEILKQFLERKIEAAKLAAAGEAADAANGIVKPRRKYISAKKLRIANRAQEILEETYLADRNTDRSTLLVRQYRPREIEVAEERAKREQRLVLAIKQAEEEEQARIDAGEIEEEDDSEEEGEGEGCEGGDGKESVPHLTDGSGQETGAAEEKEENLGFDPGSEAEQTQPLNKPGGLAGCTASKLRGLKRLPSKQDMNGIDESPPALASPSAHASTETMAEGKPDTVAEGTGSNIPVEQSTALVPVSSETETETALVALGEAESALVPVQASEQALVVASTDLVVAPTADEESLALVPMPPPEESRALVPLKSALKMVVTEVGNSTALVEFKKKRRVKFYFAEDQRQYGEQPAEPLAITNGELGEAPVGSGGSVSGDYGAVVVSDDASLSSDSTEQSLQGLSVHAPVLITTSSKKADGRSRPAGIAIPDSAADTSSGATKEAGLFDDIETVSTTTTLSSTTDGTAPGPVVPLSPALAAKAKIVRSASAGVSRLTDGELPEYLQASALVNPVPLESRRMFMFTRNSLDRKGRTDGLVHVPTTQQATALAVAGVPPSGKKKKSHVLKNQPPPRRVVASAPIQVDVSGWIFVSLADIASEINPLNTLSISLESWGGILESTREKLFEEWMPDLRLEPVVSAKTWQPVAPRCSVCSVGYVRFHSTIESFQQHPMAYINLYGSLNISSSSENTHFTHLCLACALRKELFVQSEKFFPVELLREDQKVAWPFMHRKNINESTLPAPTFSFLSGPHATSSSGPSAGTVGRAGLEVGARLSPMAQLPRIGEEAFDYPSEGGRLVLPGPHALDTMSGGDSISAVSWVTGLDQGEGSPTHHSQPNILAVLPPTSIQTTQSNSPVKSQRLQDLDAREAWERQMNPHYGTMSLYDQDSDLSSVQSGASMFSGITDSVEVHNRTGDESTISIASTVTAVNPNKKPKELALLPYLIAKGHYEEAERTLRIALAKRAVDEGEGLKVLVSLLMLQAEMYKSMGLWALALAIYFDCVDMNASLMGYHDETTLSAIALLVSCLRKMQCVALAGRYIKALCTMVQQETMKSMKMDIVDRIKKHDSAQVKEFLTHNAIWTEHLKPEVVANNPLQRRFQSVVGMGGFYSLLTAQDGYSVVARITFYKFCEDVDMKTLGVFAQFVEFCFRLRLCDEPNMYRYLIQHVTQKQLAKALVSESEVARLYRQVSSEAHVDLVIDFLNYGVQPTVVVFDAMLKIALEKLHKVYRVFLLFEPAGAMLREQRMDIIAEAYDISALIIQTAVRRRLARSRVKRVRVEHQQKEKQRQEILQIQRRKAARY